MKELAFDTKSLAAWFGDQHTQGVQIVRISSAIAARIVKEIPLSCRRCYISDEKLAKRAAEAKTDEATVLAAVLPDPGSTMSGDFGEILTYFYQANAYLPKENFGPKKWRLKENRTKPAPHSDVVSFVLPTWPTSSDKDRLICSEVKAKATDSSFEPIPAAIAGSDKDRTSRLSKTLIWLRERAITDGIGAVSVEHLDRFINATDHPRASKDFYAVAVICRSLIAEEMRTVPTPLPAETTLLLIEVDSLKKTYTEVYEAVKKTTQATSGLTKKRLQ